MHSSKATLTEGNTLLQRVWERQTIVWCNFTQQAPKDQPQQEKT